MLCGRGESGSSAKAGWHPSGLSPRQPRQHVHPRRGDSRRHHAHDGSLQQSGDLRSTRSAKQRAVDRPRARHRLGMERRRQGADLQIARRGQMARRSPVHRRGRQMHLRSVDQPGKREAAAQLSRDLVGQCRENDDQRRPRSDPSSEAATTGPAGAARLGRYPDLPLPCLAARHASASDRHRPLQIRRIQAQSGHQAHPQPGLLEAGPALSRRRRIHDHPEPVDSDPRLHRRQVRHDLPLRGDHPAIEGHQDPGAAARICPKSGWPSESIGVLVNRTVAPFDQCRMCGGRWR